MNKAVPENVDVIVIGGGLGGLIVATALKREGYGICLLDRLNHEISQSEACQGFIHSGLKLLEMPFDSALKLELVRGRNAWSRIIAAEKADPIYSMPVDYLFVHDGPRATNLLALATIHGVAAEEIGPPPFSYGFHGKAFRTDECAIDTAQFMHRLRSRISVEHHLENCVHIQTWGGGSELLAISDTGRRIHGKAVVLACADSLPRLTGSTSIGALQIKKRPLSFARLQGMQVPVAAHVFGSDPWPFLTLSSRPAQDGTWTWHIGGYIGEGCQPKESFEARVRWALQRYFPGLPAGRLVSSSISRIEPNDGQRDLSGAGQLILGERMVALLPNKATTIPDMAERVVAHLKQTVT